MTGIALLLFSLFTAPAVLTSNWEGTWMLDASASDFGMMPAPDSGMTVFTRADDRLVMTRTVWTSQRGSQTVEFDQATDGEAAAGSSSRGNEIPSRAWWEDEGEVLVLEVEVGPDQEIILTDRMSLTDENTLVLERTLEIPGMAEEIERTITYRRR